MDAIPRGNPDRAVALAALGDLRYEEGRFMEARETFEEALKLSPRRDQIRTSALIGLGNVESASTTSPCLSSRAFPGSAGDIGGNQGPGIRGARAARSGKHLYRSGRHCLGETHALESPPILEAVPSWFIQYAGALESLGIVYPSAGAAVQQRQIVGRRCGCDVRHRQVWVVFQIQPRRPLLDAA